MELLAGLLGNPVRWGSTASAIIFPSRSTQPDVPELPPKPMPHAAGCELVLLVVFSIWLSASIDPKCRRGMLSRNTNTVRIFNLIRSHANSVRVEPSLENIKPSRRA